jgi:hypothetical protein
MKMHDLDGDNDMYPMSVGKKKPKGPQFHQNVTVKHDGSLSHLPVGGKVSFLGQGVVKQHQASDDGGKHITVAMHKVGIKGGGGKAQRVCPECGRTGPEPYCPKCGVATKPMGGK